MSNGSAPIAAPTMNGKNGRNGVLSRLDGKWAAVILSLLILGGQALIIWGGDRQRLSEALEVKTNVKEMNELLVEIRLDLAKIKVYLGLERLGSAFGFTDREKENL